LARKLRIFFNNTPQHIILKSISDIILFNDQEDYKNFLNILQDLSSNISIDIHSYVLMPKYFEFIATPKEADTLSKFMQSLGRRYVGYFNKKYNRTGTIWEGRYKSSLVEAELYLFKIMSYIEKIPMFENIVSNPKDYKYSSIHKNLLNGKDDIIVYSTLYKNLGFTQEKRIEKYKNIFYKDFSLETKKFILSSLAKQSITGSVEFIKNLENSIGMSLIAKKRGRPKKENQIKDKKMYKKLVVLDKEKHKSLKINPLENLNFAKKNSFVPVTALETALVGAAFPVVFTSGEHTSLVALVSLGGESLAINAEGKWITQYVPSFFRKYPFSLGSTKENPEQKVVLIDEESPLFSKTKGKQLFKKNGEQSEVLEHAIKFLTQAEQQMDITKNIAKLISDAGILEDREIAVGEGDEKQILVNGFKVVDREKLNALSDDILADWVRKGIISFIDAHLKSLEHIETLFKIAHQRQN